MTDLSKTIAPKSDQLNADDLIGGPRTIKVSRVSKMSEPDQPIAIYFEGDNGKPYKPGLSMRRLLVRVWGSDGNAYVGRRMTLYRDDKVRFGGVDVGGIRISHMSNITSAVTMALTDKKGSRKPYRVEPLRDENGPDRGNAPERDPAPDEPRPKTGRERLHDAGRKAATGGSGSLRDFRNTLTAQQDDALAPILPELERIASDADDRDDVGFPGDRDDTFPGDPNDSFSDNRNEAA